MDLESGLDMGFFQKGWNGEEVGLGEFVGWVCWVCLNGFGLGWVCVGLGPGGFYMRTLSVAHRMKSAFLRDWSTFPGIDPLVDLSSNGAIAWTMILGPIFLLDSQNSR